MSQIVKKSRNPKCLMTSDEHVKFWQKDKIKKYVIKSLIKYENSRHQLRHKVTETKNQKSSSNYVISKC